MQKKKTDRGPISDREQSRRNQQRQQQSVADIERLLYTRRQSSHALSCSVATLVRLENAGVITKVRLAGSPSSAVFHRASQIRQLAEGGQSATLD